MENNELLRRAEDLRDRCERRSIVTATGFLTPAEAQVLRRWAERIPDSGMLLSGGREGCERVRAFFLPEWLAPEELDLADYIRAVRIEAHFGEPGHRDYLGAILGLGIERGSLGDLLVRGTQAHVFCLPSVEPLLLEEFDRAGRVGVKTFPCPLADVPVPERKVRRVSFTVKSSRFDAVLSSMFGLSRTAAAELIRLGAATLNYEVCEKPDAPVSPGDTLSLRGRGKGMLTETGGRSRKDRLFMEAEIYL